MELHQAIERAQQSGDLDAESGAVVQYQIAVTEAAHNVVLLHLLRCMEPMLAQNVRQNFELLYARREMLPLVSNHRTPHFRGDNGRGAGAGGVKRRTVTWRSLRKFCWIVVVSRAVESAHCVVYSNERTRTPVLKRHF